MRQNNGIRLNQSTLLVKNTLHSDQATTVITEATGVNARVVLTSARRSRKPGTANTMLGLAGRGGG